MGGDLWDSEVAILNVHSPGSVPSVSKEAGRDELGWAGAPGNHTLPARQFRPMLRSCLIFQEKSEIQSVPWF